MQNHTPLSTDRLRKTTNASNVGLPVLFERYPMPEERTTYRADIPAREALLALLRAPAYLPATFPTRRGLKLIYWSTVVVGLLMPVVSLLGLVFGSTGAGVM